jgi:hypothetical protein
LAVGALDAPQAAGTGKPSTRFSAHAFVGREHDREKHAIGQNRIFALDNPEGGNRFSIGANAKRLPGDHA